MSGGWQRRVRLAGRLVTGSGLHVGGAHDALGAAARSATDAGDTSARPVLRDGLGRPYVPGAALRGVLRQGVMGLLRSVDDRARGLYLSENEEESPEDVDPLRLLFGGPGQPGAVRIGDALVVADTGTGMPGAGPPVLVERREGRSVDPETGTAPDDLAFDFEVVPPGIGFDFEVFADNLTDWQLGLLLMAFDLLNDGFLAVGGLTSRGLGRVRVQWRGLLDFDPAVLLRTGGKVPAAARHEVAERRELWLEALAEHAQRPLDPPT